MSPAARLPRTTATASAQPHPPGTLPRIPAHRSLPVIQGFGWQQNLPRHPHSHAASYEAYASLAPRLPRSAWLVAATRPSHRRSPPAAHAPTARDLYSRLRIWAHGPAWSCGPRTGMRRMEQAETVNRLHGQTAAWPYGFMVKRRILVPPIAARAIPDAATQPP